MAVTTEQALSIKITNLPQIKAAFGKSPALMTRELNLAIKKSLYTIQARSMRNTPVDTGRLRASHKSIYENLKGSVGTNTNYDYYVHWGTKYMHPIPYMLSALADSETEVQDFFTKAVDKVLNEIGKMT